MTEVRRNDPAVWTARRWLGVLVVLLLTFAPGFSVQAATEDPLESANRTVFRFNDALDRWVAKPVARGYDKLPDPVKRRVHNFFENLSTPGTALNQFLQGKPKAGLNDVTRFVMNSTFGLLGLFDVATHGGLEKHQEDFGQTFAKWGIGSGPFVMLPLLGPSTTTDTVGTVLDVLTNPVMLLDSTTDRYLVRGTGLVDTRAQLLSVEEIVSGDRYLFMRDAYLQRREFLINDGVIENDPFLDDFDDYDDMDSEQ